MKKSKLLKSLAALAVGILTAISCIGLVACGGGDPAVNSVRLNKAELTLQVGGNETLTATTDPAGAAVTWTSADSTKVEVDQTGKVTAKAVTTTPVLITAKAGEKSATCNVTVEEAAPAWPKTNEFSYDALLAAIGIDPPKGYNSEAPDGTALQASYFTGVNSFITLSSASSNKVVGKKADGSNGTGASMEIKDGALSVTFEGTGTLIVNFGSTSSGNTSGLAVKNASGVCLTGTPSASKDGAPVPALVDNTVANYELNEGFYQVKGAQNSGVGQAVVTFNITEAGTYTIWGGIYEPKDDPNNPGTTIPNNKRGTRVFAIKMVDNGPQA